MRVVKRPRTMWLDLRQLEVRGSPDTQQGRQPRHPRVAAITNQCVNCDYAFADRPTAQNHVVMSWTQRHSQDTSQSHSQSLGTQEFGDLLTYCAHVRLTHLPFPSPTVRASRHAQPVRQPRRHRQHTRYGQERKPGVRQEGRQLGRRGAARQKAAPTNRQENQAIQRSQRLDDSGGQAQSRQEGQAEEPQ